MIHDSVYSCVSSCQHVHVRCIMCWCWTSAVRILCRCVSVCVLYAQWFASIHTYTYALSYEWMIFYSNIQSWVCLRCIWIWIAFRLHCIRESCDWAQRALMNCVLTHTLTHTVIHWPTLTSLMFIQCRLTVFVHVAEWWCMRAWMGDECVYTHSRICVFMHIYG
jgi:hypothetical protein